MSAKLLTVILAGFILAACRPLPAPIVTPQNAAQTEKPPVSQASLTEVDQVIFSIPNSEPWSGRDGDPRRSLHLRNKIEKHSN